MFTESLIWVKVTQWHQVVYSDRVDSFCLHCNLFYLNLFYCFIFCLSINVSNNCVAVRCIQREWITTNLIISILSVCLVCWDCIILCISSLTLGFTIISMSIAFCSCSLLMAAREIHRLFVLKILNFETDLNSSTWAFGTWAISSRRSFPSYWISVPPWESERDILQHVQIIWPTLKLNTNTSCLF